MTDGQPPVEDSDLHAWVDGQLDPARRDLVERHLAANPAARQRVADWSAQSSELRLALRQDDAAANQALLLQLARARRFPSHIAAGAMAACVMLALGVGGAAGWIAHGERRPSEIGRLGMEAAAAYRIFNGAPAVEVSAGNRAELRTLVAEKLGRRLALPDLTSMGYRLVSGRVLTAIYGPAAMLIYSDAEGDRITVYLQPMQVGLPAPMRPLQTESLDGYAWIDHQVGYTVMSEDGKARAHAVADHVLAENRL